MAAPNDNIDQPSDSLTSELFDTSFLEDPGDTDNAAQGPIRIRETRAITAKYLDSEHYGGDDNGDEGVHKKGAGRAFVQATAPSGGKQAIAGRMWLDSDNDKFYVHDGSDFTQVNAADADTVGGKTITVSESTPSGGSDGDIWFQIAST